MCGADVLLSSRLAYSKTIILSAYNISPHVHLQSTTREFGCCHGHGAQHEMSVCKEVLVESEVRGWMTS